MYVYSVECIWKCTLFRNVYQFVCCIGWRSVFYLLLQCKHQSIYEITIYSATNKQKVHKTVSIVSVWNIFKNVLCYGSVCKKIQCGVNWLLLLLGKTLNIHTRHAHKPNKNKSSHHRHYGCRCVAVLPSYLLFCVDDIYTTRLRTRSFTIQYTEHTSTIWIYTAIFRFW